ncbi:TetR/AcrR family transcriptional regulator [Pseudonocardia acaciae]|uniref:TetR/AcrR family transcriptional regulator n=1 Tax=Pseudonocardia acaciae TaxID=551276 RepID=UPI00048A89CA|nr:TetR/AcrR family transcriptional regulator [Pseudonocardia acaciae]
MASREAWLAAGEEALVTDGAPGVKIDKLAARLEASKGSYYHHFGSARGFKLALLERLENVHTRRYIEAVEATPGLGAEQRLRRLVELGLRAHPVDGVDALEVAVRAWAHQDDDVRAAQERIDAIRIEYLLGLCRELGDDEAEPLAQIFYVLLIGATHLLPPLTTDQLRRIYELALRLVPS